MTKKILTQDAALVAQHHTTAQNGAYSPVSRETSPLDVVQLAAQWNLKAQPDGTFRGRNPFTNEGTDRFVLFPEGNGAERNGAKYSRADVAKLAGVASPSSAKRRGFKASNAQNSETSGARL